MFEWQSFVKTLMPGDKSVEALKRKESLPSILAELTEWAEKYSMWEKRVESIAFFGVCTTPVHLTKEAIIGISKHALWFFSLDDYIDRNEYLLKNHEIPYLDRQLSQTAKVIENQLKNYGLYLNPALEFPLEKWSQQLGSALIDIFQGLENSWRNRSQKAWLLSNLTEQTILMLRAMREELVLSFDYGATQNPNKVPKLEEYIELARYSIGVRAIASVAISMEKNPSEIWQSRELNLSQAMRIVRLANDLGNYASELEEGKVTSITSVLLELGYTNPMQYPDGSPEVNAARQIVKERMEKEIADFGRDTAGIEGEFVYWLRAVTALALAMYQHGNYLVIS